MGEADADGTPGQHPRERNPTTSDAPQTRNIVYILQNGQPNEYAICRDVPVDQTDVDGVAVWRFDGVPDDICDAIEECEKPSHYGEELVTQSTSNEGLEPFHPRARPQPLGRDDSTDRAPGKWRPSRLAGH